MSIRAVVLFTISLVFPAISHAVPLTMSYSVTNTGSAYQYDFKLELDNNDASWVSGQEWDWIIFGDAKYGASPLADYDNFIATQLPEDTLISTTMGVHNGPTLMFHHSPILPGWEPTVVGESILWQVSSSTFLDQGELLWSTMLWTGFNTTLAANFEVANRVSANVPEPSISWLLVSGLAILGFTRRKALY